MQENEVTAGDALVEIAEIEPGALKLVGDLMAHNARSLEWQFEQLYLGEKHAHEETRQRLRDANEHIDRIQRRLAWLGGGPDELLDEGGWA